MARKSRRDRRKEKRQRKQPVQMQDAAVAARISPHIATPATPPVDLGKEYAYVFADLRKIALIAAGMLVLLLVLAFVLR